MSEDTNPVLRFVVTAPVFEIENNVEVAEAVEEPIAKRVVAVSPLLACTESFAKGVVVPMPAFPLPLKDM